MIEVKQAVSTAIDSLKNFYGEPQDLLLEEVYRSEDGKYWLITLGFSVPGPSIQMPNIPGNPLLSISTALNPTRRLYKVFQVDAETGKFVSMKIREAEAA
jgi:hypothetical protein